MLSHVRPVGEPVSLRQASSSLKHTGYHTSYVGSGTQALQTALSLACKTKQTKQPEAIIPAYGCPDLVSACIGAGVKPVLVDLAPDSLFPCTTNLDASSNEHTIAVVLVNFLGISPPSNLFEWCKSKDLISIEDRAQSFVEPNNSNELKGDMVIFSFGKGKPVSLLGGGAILVSSSLSLDAQTEIKIDPEKKDVSLPYRIKTFIYNLVIRPFFYGCLLKLPGLNIGATEYKAPLTPEPLGLDKVRMLPSNITHQHQRNVLAEEQLAGMVQQKGWRPLAKATPNSRLLRYPVLLTDNASREAALSALTRSGIGASTMYNAALVDIPGVPLPEDQKSKSFPNATNLADRLLTLPCHSGVNAKVMGKIERELTKLPTHSPKPN